METVVWVVERDFGTPTSSDWRYWAFPSRYLDEAWSKDWNLAIKTHDRDACERICEDMPDHWDIRICDHQIVDVTRPSYQTLETRVDELERALAGVRELMGEEHTYWACYPAQGPHNAVLRDYTKAWCKLIDRLIEGETFEEFTLVDEVDKYFKKEQHR